QYVHNQHSFPTRRSSDLTELNTLRAIGRVNLDNGLSIRGLYQVSDVEDADASIPVNATVAGVTTNIAPAFARNIDDAQAWLIGADRKSTRLNSSHVKISY